MKILKFPGFRKVSQQFTIREAIPPFGFLSLPFPQPDQVLPIREPMEPRYPSDGSSYMNKDGLSDPCFQIAHGKLLYNLKRDARFPYIYKISTHVQVYFPQHIKMILIHVIDTAEEA